MATGGTIEREVAPELVEALCLDDRQLHSLNALAARCEQVYGPARDIEWAYADDQIYLLQCRAVTHRSQSRPSRALPGGPAEVIGQVPFFTGLSDRDKTQIASMFKERMFAAGETIIKEGVGAAAFFVIESGEATVSIRGKPIRKLGRGDYFGEIALIDEGARSATVTADSELHCYGMTSWEFRPLVETNAAIAWHLLQTMAKRLRAAEQRTT